MAVAVYLAAVLRRSHSCALTIVSTRRPANQDLSTALGDP